MKTPVDSPYPVLDDRPIDQWKVTELKDELKRRKLTTRGLKEDLVRRLDDALRSEMNAANFEANNGNGVQGSEADSTVTEDPIAVTVEPVISTENPVAISEEPVSVTQEPVAEAATQTVERVTVVADLGVVAPGNAEEAVVNDDANAIRIEFGFKNSAEQLGEDKSLEEKEPGTVNVQASGIGLEISTDAPATIVSVSNSNDLSSGNAVGGQGLEGGKSETVNGDSRVQQQFGDIMPPHEDVKLDSSDSINQVSEVSTSLGFPVKSNNSISTDFLSINEKNDLKDNIIADNVELESDVKPEMVQPSSSDLLTDGGRSHPMDVDKPHENKVSVKETDNTVANEDMSQKNSSADLGSPEKLNLDRSSGDDSMEEDALESKHINSNYNAEEVEGKTEKSEVTIVKGESPVATMDTDLLLEKKGIHDEENVMAVTSDKRKLSDQEAAVNKPAKRQHRWKIESNSVSVPQTLDITLEAPSKDVPSPASLKPSFSRSDSIGAIEPLKEREVPPSTKPSTNSLRIDRFLRPFTLKAVQELLGKTGKVTTFWMDHIKTHCYVTYSSVEEATETRNAVYNLLWPPNGGRQLVAEFVEPEEVKLRAEPSAQPPVQPVASAPIKAPEPPMAQPSPRQQNLRQQMAQQRNLPPPPPLPNQGPVKDLALPPPPPRNEKVDPPIVTLDDLFRKTKATPRIYYLPLSEERVSAILEERRKKANQ